MNGSMNSDKSIGAVFKELTEDLSTLVRSEIALAKLEIKQSAILLGGAGAMFAIAVFFAIFGIGFLFVTAVLGLVAVGVPAWLSTLIVALILLGGAAALAFVGKAKLAKLTVVPQATVDNVKQDIASIKNDLTRLKQRTS